MYTPVNPNFYYLKVWCKGVWITRTCFPDVVSWPNVPEVPVELLGGGGGGGASSSVKYFSATQIRRTSCVQFLCQPI